jgi:hypothetical protein
MTPLLKRYWFKFVNLPKFDAMTLGCGVTAYDYDDAISLMRQTVFAEKEMPTIGDVVENVDIRTLDQGNVVPNMEAPVWRGVWFPRGYKSDTSR